MKAVVVYESHWGNTAAIGRAIAEGTGPTAIAATTDEATASLIADADLVVAGAPVIGFRLPTDGMLANMATTESRAPDLSHPSMRALLSNLPSRQSPYASFETGLWWSPGGARGEIERGFERAGYRRLTKGERFVVTGRYGPLRPGELERARTWGASLAETLRQAA